MSEDGGMGQAGGRSTLQRLVDDHYAPLYRYAYRLSGSADRASDLTQEAFCKAQAQLYQLRDPERAKPWLFSILRNAFLHRVRTDRQHREVSLEWADSVCGEESETPSEIEPHLLQAALDELPEGFRTPLILFYFNDFSYRDIAEQMELPIGTVMSRLARAKAHLRQRFAEPESCGRKRDADGL